MLIKKDTCQKIVDRFKNILDKSINVMDLEGEIIASTNQDRIGTFHKGAQLCARSGEELIITQTNQMLYKGCWPGINLPIYDEGEVIGVVGITGEPEELKGYALLVKELVELIVSEDEKRRHAELKEDIARSFFYQLFNESHMMQEEVLQTRAHMARFEYEKDKKILVVDFAPQGKHLSETTGSFEKQKQKNKLISYMRTKLQIGENVIDLYEDEIILIVEANPDSTVRIEQLITDIEDQYGIKVRMYSSDICRGLKMYGTEYKNTKRLLKLCKNKEISTQALVGVGQYKLELMIDTLAQEEKAYYLASYKKIFEAVPKDKNYYDLLKTVRVYFEKDMDIIETAERMTLHRNTIRYRLNKFKEVYDIDVSKPYECMKLYIAIKLYME